MHHQAWDYRNGKTIPHAHRELYTILFSRCFTLRVRFLTAGSESYILVVEITYDFGSRIETGSERPLLLLYIIY